MPYKSVEEALAAGKTQAEIDAYIPPAVAMFFSGKKMGDMSEAFMKLLDPSFMLSFVGPNAPPVPPLDITKFPQVAGAMVASFPDFTFNSGKAVPTKQADGSWAADIIVTGTHTGAPFAPMPGLTPMPAKGVKCDIGPEKFSLFPNAEGKLTKLTIEPLHAGKPAGPPGFYVLVGGTLPAPAAAAAESKSADGVNREGIERNLNGSEEPSSADPELWNIDGTEVDYLVKYKLGGQMWYVQSRMRENPPKGMPIPGFPINQKAKDAKRYYKVEDDSGAEVEYNKSNDKSTHWQKSWQVPPA